MIFCLKKGLGSGEDPSLIYPNNSTWLVYQAPIIQHSPIYIDNSIVIFHSSKCPFHSIFPFQFHLHTQIWILLINSKLEYKLSIAICKVLRFPFLVVFLTPFLFSLPHSVAMTIIISLCQKTRVLVKKTSPLLILQHKSNSNNFIR